MVDAKEREEIEKVIVFSIYFVFIKQKKRALAGVAQWPEHQPPN